MTTPTPYALYLDPSVTDNPWQPWPTEHAVIGYYRLTDLPLDQVSSFNPHTMPPATYKIIELHPLQWDALNITADRYSFVIGKSSFGNLGSIKERLRPIEVDITFDWDHRFHLNYYIKLINYWLYCGVRHYSFYGLTDFDVWQRLQAFLAREGVYFYDRYHACVAGAESRYQKHIARFGNLLALGGWSRWTDMNGITATRGPKEPDWHVITAHDQTLERLLFAMADRDGMAMDHFNAATTARAVRSGLAETAHGALRPTDAGLWDTVGLVSQLQQI